MAAKYFNIPLGNLPALVELQNMLRRKLPEGTIYNAPDTFHLTLVYVEDDKGIDLMFEEIASGLPVFGFTGDFVSTFEKRGENVPVILRIERSPQLIYLQSSIYYRAMAAGAKISQFSYPSRWRPQITLATLPTSPEETSYEAWNEAQQYLDFSLNAEVRTIAVTEDGSFEPVKSWPLLGDIPIQEFMNGLEPNVTTGNPKIQLMEQTAHPDAGSARMRVELTCASEMKGAVPNLKLPDDIDLTAIQASGFKFVTLPIGAVDAQSRNERNYRRPAYEQMVAQINTNRPEGGWGHIKEEDMGTSYDPPAIRWLRAELAKDGTIWGKGLPLTPDANSYFELARATNARVGTSLHAWVTLEGDDVVGMELIRLDLADPARVGVPMTAAQPQLSSEMGKPANEAPGSSGESSATASSTAAETTTEGQGAASPSTTQAQENRQQVNKETNPVSDEDKKRVTELETERRNLNEQIARLESENRKMEHQLHDAQDVYALLGLKATEQMDIVRAARLFKEQYEDMVTESTSLIADSIKGQVDQKVAVESARPIITKMVTDRKPATRKALGRELDAILADPIVTELIKTKLAAESGPNQPPPNNNRQPGQSTQGNPANVQKAMEQFFEMPEGAK